MEHLYQVYADRPVTIGSLEVTPFHMSHDAADPVCYTVEASGHKVGMATDLGVYDDYDLSSGGVRSFFWRQITTSVCWKQDPTRIH